MPKGFTKPCKYCGFTTQSHKGKKHKCKGKDLFDV